MKHFFSIIIPIFNTYTYLEECLNSVLLQSFKDFEIICVNDGNDDKSYNLASKIAYKSKGRVKVYQLDKVGVGGARNFGVSVSNSEYIVFLDGDDYISRKCLSCLHDTIINKNNPDIVLLYPTIFDMETKTCTDWMDNIFIKDIFKENVCLSVRTQPKLQNAETGSCRCVFNKNFLEKNAIKYPTNCNFFEDVSFRINSFHLAKKITICDLPNAYYYRVNSARNNSSKLTDNKRLSIFEIYNPIFKKITLEKWDESEKVFIISTFLRQIIWCRQFTSAKLKLEYYRKAHFYFKKYVTQKNYKCLKTSNICKRKYILFLKLIRLPLLYLLGFLIF